MFHRIVSKKNAMVQYFSTFTTKNMQNIWNIVYIYIIISYATICIHIWVIPHTENYWTIVGKCLHINIYIYRCTHIYIYPYIYIAIYYISYPYIIYIVYPLSLNIIYYIHPSLYIYIYGYIDIYTHYKLP